MIESKRPLFDALLRVAQKTGYLQKGGRNEALNYSFVQEAGAIAHLRPHLLEEGILMFPSARINQIDQWGNCYVDVDYKIVHAPSGDTETFSMPGCGNDYKPKSGLAGDKGVPKAITSANKYALLKLFQIATGDDPEVPNEVDRDDEPIRQNVEGSTPMSYSPPQQAAPPQPTPQDQAEETAAELLSFAEECKSKPELEAYWKQNLATVSYIKELDKPTYQQTVNRLKELHARF